MLDIEDIIRKATGANYIISSECVQSLWSGYGEIRRYHLKGGKYESVIVKHIQLPKVIDHPQGWNTEISHQRKIKSYQVESVWYQEYAKLTNTQCRVPQCYYSVEEGPELLLIMEDLDASGYHLRIHHDHVNLEHAKSCLSWLAHFHAKFMEVKPEGLWPIGTYWHLETRPDEFFRMQNASLKNAARSINEKLTKAKYQTIVHGDAKLANFCFSKKGEVAAVDFQYVGRGCGMKDVAYLISSCFDETDCEKYASELLDFYFNQLELSLDNTIDYQEVKMEWKELYRYAWADFYRFLDGWSPGHWKMHDYSIRLTQKVLEELDDNDSQR